MARCLEQQKNLKYVFPCTNNRCFRELNPVAFKACRLLFMLFLVGETFLLSLHAALHDYVEFSAHMEFSWQENRTCRGNSGCFVHHLLFFLLILPLLVAVGQELRSREAVKQLLLLKLLDFIKTEVTARGFLRYL